MFSIECQNLVKEFKSVTATVRPVDGLSLRLNAGEIHAVIGESGCGKTTLLRMILGKDTDYEGTIWLAPSLKPTYLTQDVLDLDENMTVMELASGQGAEYRTKFLTNLANMNMSKQVFGRKISTLSLGERMRIKMNEVISSDFNLLILEYL